MTETGPTVRPSVLTQLEQQIICMVRRHTELPLDDLFVLLKPYIPKLSRSNLHRCLQHYGISRLPKEETAKPKKKFKDYPIGYVHVDITELRCETGKWYLFVGIERKTKYVYVELYQRMTMENAVTFLYNLQKDCVFRITHVLTDNGSQFTYKLLAKHLQPNKAHPFDEACEALNIEHRTTKFKHPWTNGQVEITNKMLKQATVKQFHYSNAEELKVHLQTFLLYYNYQKKLKSLKLKSPWQVIEECYNENPDDFILKPNDKTVGLNTDTVPPITPSIV